MPHVRFGRVAFPLFMAVAMMTSCTKTVSKPTVQGDARYADDHIAIGPRVGDSAPVEFLGSGTVTIEEATYLMMDFDGDRTSEVLGTKKPRDNRSMQWGRVIGDRLVWEDVPRAPDGYWLCFNRRFVQPFKSALLCFDPRDHYQWLMLSKGTAGFSWQRVPTDGLPAAVVNRLNNPDRTLMFDLGFFHVPDAVSQLLFVDGAIWAATYIPAAATYQWRIVGQYTANLNRDHMAMWSGQFIPGGQFDTLLVYDWNTGNGWRSEGGGSSPISLTPFESRSLETGNVPCLPCGKSSFTSSWTTRYKGDPPVDSVLLYYEGGHEWWKGTFLGGTLYWSRVSKSDGLGDLYTGWRTVRLGSLWTEQNPTGDHEEEILVYSNSSSDWNMAFRDASPGRMLWRSVGNSRNIHGTPRFYNYKLFIGSFVSGVHEQVLYYSIYPKGAWLGEINDALQLIWKPLAE